MSRSLCPALLAVVAIPLVAVDEVESWGGRDLIVLRSGAELSGRVLADDGVNISLDAGFAEVSLEKARISRIESGHGIPTRRAAAPQPPDAGPIPPRRWEVSAGLTWGMHLGSVDAVGTITGPAAPATSPESLSLALDGADAGPGGWLRLATRSGCLFYGLQAATSTAGGDSASLSMQSPEAVLGLGVQTAGSARWDLALAIGWGFAQVSRDLHLRDAAGAVVDTATADDSMNGPIVRLELAPSWRCGDWRLGAVGGVAWCSLRGSSTWTSAGGGYSGSDDLSARLTAAYFGATASLGW